MDSLFNKKDQILLNELIRTDFKLRYQGSFIGHLWSILKPLMLFAITYVVFVRFLRFDDGIKHNAVSLLLGMVVWNFFSEATNMGMMSIVSRGDLLRKLSFSQYIVVISAVSGASINFFINLVVVLIFTLISGIPFNFGQLVIIPIFVELLLFVTGIAFILSTLFVKYRDIGPIWEVILQGGLYVTPVIYTISFVLMKTTTGAKLMALNPLAQIIQDLRHFAINSENLTAWQLINNKFYLLIPYGLPLIMFLVGFYVFNRHARKFAEIL